MSALFVIGVDFRCKYFEKTERLGAMLVLLEERPNWNADILSVVFLEKTEWPDGTFTYEYQVVCRTREAAPITEKENER